MCFVMYVALLCCLVFVGITFASNADIIVSWGGEVHFHTSCGDRNLHFRLPAHDDIGVMCHVPGRESLVYSADSSLFLLKLQDGAKSSNIISDVVLEDIAAWDSDILVATDPSRHAIVQISLPLNKSSTLARQHVLVHLENASRPRGIAVHEGGVFWVDWRYGNQSVWWAALSNNGAGLLVMTSRSRVVSSGLYLPSGVAVDAAHGWLYLSDVSKDKRLRIERVRAVDGSQRQQVFSTGSDRRMLSSHPLLRLLDDTLYWGDSDGVWSLAAASIDNASSVTPRRLLSVKRALSDVLLLPSDRQRCAEYGHSRTTVSLQLPDPRLAQSRDPVVQAECAPLFCLNGGRCVSRGGGGSTSFSGGGGGACQCRAGFWGERCEKDGCWQLCLNGGTCVRPLIVLDTGGTSLSPSLPHCVCDRSSAGTRCERIINSTILPQPSCTTHDANTTRSGSLHLPFNLSLNQTRWLLVVLPALCILLSLLLCGAVAFSARRRWRTCSDHVTDSSSPPRRRARRIIGVPRHKSTSPLMNGDQRRRGDIEDCCQMTLCERPCELRLKSAHSTQRSKQ